MSEEKLKPWIVTDVGEPGRRDVFRNGKPICCGVDPIAAQRLTNEHNESITRAQETKSEDSEVLDAVAIGANAAREIRRQASDYGWPCNPTAIDKRIASIVTAAIRAAMKEQEKKEAL